MLLCEASLEDRVGRVAQASPYLTRSKIQVATEENRVVLRGVVRSYYEKQMAQETVLRVDGVAAVVNHLEVLRRRAGSGTVCTVPS